MADLDQDQTARESAVRLETQNESQNAPDVADASAHAKVVMPSSSQPLELLQEEHHNDSRRFNDIIATTKPTTPLEIALTDALVRKDATIERMTKELHKLKNFVQKRKQTYKRKRKDDGAPIRALSGYNLFIKERFKQLAKENEEALKSQDATAEMKRVPPANLVARTGNEWKALPAEIKAKYDERAKADRKRYEDEMAEYDPPDRHSTRRRNKTGYNMFFSAHVARLKETEAGVPSERGCVARIVANAWKELSSEDKAYYEREADKHNGMNSMKDAEEEEEDDARMPFAESHQYEYPEMPHHPLSGLPGLHPAVAHEPSAHGHQPYYSPHAYAHYDYSQPQGRHHMYQYNY